LTGAVTPAERAGIYNSVVSKQYHVQVITANSTLAWASPENRLGTESKADMISLENDPSWCLFAAFSFKAAQ